MGIENVLKFLKDAPDDIYILIKTVLIVGLAGACRKGELCNLMFSDIQDTGNIAIVTLRDTKTKKHRTFTITADCDSYSYYKKYVALRPDNVQHDRFFLQYKDGKCTVGINSFSKFPQKIARFLDLPEPTMYTGHCFRRTSASFLADSGVDIRVLKRHGGWRSDSTAEGYVEDSLQNKIRIAKNIFKCASNETEFNQTAVQKLKVEETEVRKTVLQETVVQETEIHKTALEKVIISDDNSVQQIRPCTAIQILTQVDSTAHSIQKNEDFLKMGYITISNINNCTINVYHNDK